jgi:glutamine amidotransferase|tara:strand:+ start:2076 stop:2684 length:609 start_codon:yes stop_codon:yes gene_type:complete
MRPKVAIIDFGVGNLRSAQKAFELNGANAVIVKDKDTLNTCDAIVLPGVGAFCDAMNNLNPFNKLLIENSKDKLIFGICLGMQLFFEQSEENGLHKGLKLMKGGVVKLPNNVKIPHIGWNTIDIKTENNLLKGIKSKEYFYFVHSYYALPSEEITLATTHYGVEIPAVVSKGNMVGTQFHPEKSGKAGLRIIDNFVDLVREM